MTTTTETPAVAETIEAWKCLDCGAITQERYDVPRYECNNDGTIFARDSSADGGSHRCPECNKFASKLADESCEDCEGEVEAFQAVDCQHCDELHEDGDIPLECQDALDVEEEAEPVVAGASVPAEEEEPPNDFISDDLTELPISLPPGLWLVSSGTSGGEGRPREDHWIIKGEARRFPIIDIVRRGEGHTEPYRVGLSCSACEQVDGYDSLVDALQAIRRGRHYHGRVPYRMEQTRGETPRLI